MLRNKRVLHIHLLLENRDSEHTHSREYLGTNDSLPYALSTRTSARKLQPRNFGKRSLRKNSKLNPPDTQRSTAEEALHVERIMCTSCLPSWT